MTLGNGINANFVALNLTALKPYDILQVLIASAGILGNAWILATTATSNVLRSNTNILIALLALADLFACGGFLVVSAMTAFNVSVVFRNGIFDILELYSYFTLRQCGYINVPIAAFCNVEDAFMLILGIDRLFAVANPAR